MTYATKPATDYRSDIDGLRAVSVLMVVFYHAFPNWLPGGFIGVDVFFVISGYLISRIVYKDLAARKFSFINFYGRRIRRILPGVTLILLACIGLGWLLLWPNEYVQLNKQVIGATTFTSNILLWRESGYFDSAAEVKPLLHLWSLAIEEQFYLLWPITLWVVAWRPTRLFLTIIFLMLGSFAINIWLIRTNAVSAFYLPHSRSWELLLGALLGLLTNPTAGKESLLISWLQQHIVFSNWFYRLCALLGPTLLLLSLLLINKNKVFPGYWALLPAIGAACIIHTGGRSIFNKVLSGRILVWIGLISFPLYLWHWPLLSFSRIAFSDNPPVSVRLFLVIVSLVISWLTYHFVEKACRGAQRSRLTTLILIFGFIALTATALAILQDQGVASRHIAQDGAAVRSTADAGGAGIQMDGDCGLAAADIPKVYHCLSDSREKPIFALIGDSKALALLPGLIRTSTQGSRWLSINGITPATKDSPIKDRDEVALETTLDALARNSDVEIVVIANGARTLLTPRGYDERKLRAADNLEDVLREVAAVTDRLIAANKTVVFVLDNPTLANPEDCLERNTGIDWFTQLVVRKNARCSIATEKHLDITSNYRKIFERLKLSHPSKVFTFDTTPSLCSLGEGVCNSLQNGRMMYSYSDHISDYASGLIGSDLNSFVHSIRSNMRGGEMHK
jgi:peptidoglycan/LPS O-acetylase OafA/YrhL